MTKTWNLLLIVNLYFVSKISKQHYTQTLENKKTHIDQNQVIFHSHSLLAQESRWNNSPSYNPDKVLSERSHWSSTSIQYPCRQGPWNYIKKRLIALLSLSHHEVHDSD